MIGKDQGGEVYEFTFEGDEPPTSEAQEELRAWLAAVMDLRKTMLAEDRDPSVVLPSDLARFNLVAWEGRIFGMRCVPSPIVSA